MKKKIFIISFTLFILINFKTISETYNFIMDQFQLELIDLEIKYNGERNDPKLRKNNKYKRK